MRGSFAQQTEIAVGRIEVAEAEAAEVPQGRLHLVELVDEPRELGACLAPALLLGRMEEPFEGGVDRRRVPCMRPPQSRRSLGTAKPEAAAERRQRVGIVRDEVRLTLRDDLQLVLDVAQEAVGGRERPCLLGGDVAASGEALESRERAALPQACVLSAVHEL